MSNATATQATVQANRATIRGRILEVQRRENVVYTDIVLPAPDSYSQPQNVRIISSRLIGKPGDDVTQCCTIKGYRRAYNDKQTGERRYSVDIALSALED